MAIRYGFDSKLFKKYRSGYRIAGIKYQHYLQKAYPTNRFITLTEDQYWNKIDKNNFITSTGYAKYKTLKGKNLKAAMKLLDDASKAARDFQEYNVYQLEMADQYVKHEDTLDDIGNKKAVGKYKEILDQNKYSLFLFETWVKWRAVYQQNNGLSHTSDIPNDRYDQVREQAAAVVLDYVANHLPDQMAINEFTQLATHDIVRRFGDYKFGNQNTIEYHELFDAEK